MEQNDQAKIPASPRRWALGRTPRFVAAALGLVVAAAGLIVGVCSTGCKGGTPAGVKSASARLFHDWPRDRKPDFVLLLSGQMHGYTMPCGCSRPQLGGLDRRYNFEQMLLKERGWPVVAVDLGDLAEHSGPQALLKYTYSMKALKAMAYTAIGVGQNEMRMPLFEALGAYALNFPVPRVLAANLRDKDTKFPDMVKSVAITEAGGKGGPKVGVVGVVGPSLAKVIRDADVAFDGNDKVLPALLKQIGDSQDNPEFLVLLYQGSVEEAKSCAQRFPQFQVVLCLTQEEEPASQPDRVGNTLVVGVGHKGRYVGVVGAYRSGKDNPAFDLHYQLAEMAEDYMTPNDKDSPILKLLESYANDVKSGNYLAHYAAKKINHPIQMEPEFKDATYVGSDRCKRCHQEAYKVWKNSKHAQAYDTLVQVKRPPLRQYDGECVACHVTGFEHTGGFTGEAATPLLKDNGCENCHGPGSIHAKGGKNWNNPKLLALMNPFKAPENETPEARTQRLNHLDQSCQKCHDIDNDVNWPKKTIEQHFAEIAHPEPKEK